MKTPNIDVRAMSGSRRAPQLCHIRAMITPCARRLRKIVRPMHRFRHLERYGFA
jgi:hypothetical protein